MYDDLLGRAQFKAIILWLRFADPAALCRVLWRHWRLYAGEYVCKCNVQMGNVGVIFQIYFKDQLADELQLSALKQYAVT